MNIRRKIFFSNLKNISLVLFVFIFISLFPVVSNAKNSDSTDVATIKEYINKFGLSKPTTWGKFWEKSQYYYSGRTYLSLKAFVASNKELPMPIVTVRSAKNGNGEEIPVLELAQDGKLQTVQINGESNNWAKINGTNFSLRDLNNPQRAFEKLKNSSPSARQEIERYNSELMKSYFSNFKGFTQMNPILWKKLTKHERLEYLSLIKKTLQILSDFSNKSDAAIKNTDQNQSSYSLINFISVFLGTGAFAALTTQNYNEALREWQTHEPAFKRAVETGQWTQALDKTLVQFQKVLFEGLQNEIKQCVEQPIKRGRSKPKCPKLNEHLNIAENYIAPLRQKLCDDSATYIGIYTEEEKKSRIIEPNSLIKSKNELNKVAVSNELYETLEVCACKNDPTHLVKFRTSCGPRVDYSARICTGYQVVQCSALPGYPPTTTTQNKGFRWPWDPPEKQPDSIDILAWGSFKGPALAVLSATAGVSEKGFEISMSCQSGGIGSPPACSCVMVCASSSFRNDSTCACDPIYGLGDDFIYDSPAGGTNRTN